VTTTEDALCVRWADRPGDLVQLEFLLHRGFPDEAWTEDDLRRFRRKQDRNNVVKVLSGADDEPDADNVFGGLLYTVEPTKVRVRRIVIAEEYRGRGYGAFLLNTLIGPRSAVRRRFYEARVPEEETGAHLFFGSAGFRVPRIGGILHPSRAEEKQGAKPRYLFTFQKHVPALVAV
jgi:GNAT superfamily N-acetyltransferase